MKQPSAEMARRELNNNRYWRMGLFQELDIENYPSAFAYSRSARSSPGKRAGRLSLSVCASGYAGDAAPSEASSEASTMRRRDAMSTREIMAR